VSRYVASDWTIDYNKVELGQLWNKDPVKHIKAFLDEPQRTVKAVHILIGGFMETLLHPLFGIFDASSDTFNYWGTGHEIWEGTTYYNDAEYTAAIALDTTAVGIQRGIFSSMSMVTRLCNYFAPVVGGRSTFFDIVELFKEIYGIEPKLNNLGSLDDLFKHMHQVRERDPQNWLSYVFLSVSSFHQGVTCLTEA
jgi:hypothetical protein